MKLHWQIFIAIGLAVVAGILTGETAGIGSFQFYDLYVFLGSLFLNALKMLIVPLIFSSIICGIGNMGDLGGLGRLGGKTIAYYMSTSVVAILIGLLLVNIVEPGIIDGEPVRDRVGLTADISDIEAKVEGKGAGDLTGVFLRMVPTNIVAAAANGQMLGLIFFGLLFGYFLTHIAKENKTVLLTFWNAVFEIMMKMTDWVMKFAPLGVFGLVAKVVASTGLAAFLPLAYFFFTVVFALGVHIFVVMPIALKWLGRVQPLRHYKAMFPALLTAFSTSSSSATLPLTMECVEKNAGVSNRTSSFVLPLGATINMDGTALYECVAAMFIAQAYGLDLGVTEQFLIVITALVTSVGVAGIPAASLVAISIILATIGLPLEGIGLILAVDRVLDMCRTSVNVFSDSCGAVIIARSEGEDQVLRS
ncbi:MAG: dicarboxylate/amino acid:cation symporter [Methylococcales symbiont of Hymedesmia sp. n. MRB-2018]|nr:MAG: dicarboxylate/amino acid:cation symporter [Methylococcales symbiont of Hymedesmia sp. n. MRB-2018]KAF3982926.1 MAG: dicarboxylate/amino acid:cation symporter [Methylococcales symbiont of Hymedesmia sp. n. MRB-2018]